MTFQIIIHNKSKTVGYISMFMVSAACRKEMCFPSLGSACLFIYFSTSKNFKFYLYIFLSANLSSWTYSPPSQHFHFLHLNVRNTFKGHLSIDKHFLCTWLACCSQPRLDSKLPAGLLKRTDMTWLCCCTEKRGPSTLSSVAILGGGWWESQLQDFINELHRRPQGTKRA